MSLDKITVAKRYAKALFELLDENSELQTTLPELQQLRQIFQDNPQLSDVLLNTTIPVADRDALVADLSKDASPYVSNLIHMVYDYKRMDAMTAIIDQFQVLVDERDQRIYANITTAMPLESDQQQRIMDAFKQRVNAKEVVADTKVDDSIIGGVVVESSGIILDGSLKTKLNRIRQTLTK